MIRMISSLFLLLLGAVSWQARAQSGPGPNVIFILADDLGYGDLGSFGQKNIPTPNLDRMAAQGMRLTRHYAGASVCAPSRCALFTGKHTGHTSVRGNQPKGQLIDPAETTLPEVFKSAGYTTGLIGKWGLGNKPPNDDPARNGFDYHYGYVDMWHAHAFYTEFLYRNGQKVILEGNSTRLNPEAEAVMKRTIPADISMGLGVNRAKYTPYEFEREALEFIERNRTKPFFLFYSAVTPHANTEFKKEGMEVSTFGEFANKDWPDPEKGFAQMMRDLDNMVGHIFAKLEATGLADNTLVVFTSDNGPHKEGGHHFDYFDSNGKLRGSKRDLYEGGVRVPTLVWWKNKIQPGSNSAHVSAFWDWLPTFARLTGTQTPGGIDGLSILPSLLQHGKQKKHPYLYWEFYEEGGKQAALWRNWKLVKLNLEDPANTQLELYNLAQDESETNNLANTNPKIVKRMESLLQEAHRPFPLVSLFKKDQGKATQ